MDKQFIRKIIFAGIALATVVYLKYVLNFGAIVFSFFTPLIIGGAMAFVMNILMAIIEKRMLKNISKKSLRRATALILTILFIFVLLTTLILLVIPEMISTFSQIADDMPSYISEVKSKLVDTKVLGFSFEQYALDFESVLTNIIAFITENSDMLIEKTLGVTSSVLSIIINTFLGFVFAIYILISKEALGGNFKRLFKTLLKEKHYNQLIELNEMSYITFKNFVTGQFLEAIIIGGLCFIGMIIFSMPYALTISSLVGFTALIPVFGAFIGTTIGVFLIVIVSPIKALWFVIFIVILQQLEGNLIYPKVVGESIGLPGIWVLAAVTIGASAYGILGMLIGVPLTSIVYNLIKKHVRSNPKRETIQAVLESDK